MGRLNQEDQALLVVQEHQGYQWHLFLLESLLDLAFLDLPSCQVDQVILPFHPCQAVQVFQVLLVDLGIHEHPRVQEFLFLQQVLLDLAVQVDLEVHLFQDLLLVLNFQETLEVHLCQTLQWVLCHP